MLVMQTQVKKKRARKKKTEVSMKKTRLNVAQLTDMRRKTAVKFWRQLKLRTLKTILAPALEIIEKPEKEELLPRKKLCLKVFHK